MTQPSTAIVAHTAGPWIVTDERDRFHGGEVIRPIDRTHSPVAIVCDFNRFDRDAEREANARLIAAAPELLEALKECRDELFKRIDVLTAQMSNEVRQTYLQFPPIVKADVAIAKAEGRS